MNREQKLSLIIGFSLILLVGVLISDHLSGARTATIPGVDADEAVLIEPQLTQADMAVEPFVGPSPEPEAPLPALDTQANAVATQAGPQPTEPFTLINQSGDAAPIGGLLDEIARQGGTILERGADLIFELPAEPLAEAERPARRHVVEEGDTLWALAQRYYSDGARWTAIAEANDLDPDRPLRVGMALAIPGAPGADNENVPVEVVRTYTVRANDTIGEIALALLGTSRRWPEIARLNDIEDENLLYEGQVLKIPPK